MDPHDERHGTYAGYQRHRNDGEDPCGLCREANAAYQRDIRGRSPDLAQRGRDASNARSRALTRLANEYEQRFRELYDEETAR